MGETRLEQALRRDRAIVAAALGVIAVLAWVYVLGLARGMDMGGMDMRGARMISTGVRMAMAPAAVPWSGLDFAMMFVMWAVMMIGMMTPSAAPLILLYARVGRQAVSDGRPFAATGWFAGGYLSAWVLFALAATVAQLVLERAALLTPGMAAASDLFGAAVLIAAGLYQWSRLKDTCLVHCQSPLSFLQHHGGFRRDAAGSFGLGLSHGAYCLGCCWALMLLLFVGGVMNLAWIAGLSILVLVEKLASRGRLVARAAGVAFIVAGLRLAAGVIA
ncbi:MAG: DUF2182 domain-containing protein [Acidobacteria bacterium]|nr:DUF2182 domain-containing protein [Acidobacteriota bacterium]